MTVPLISALKIIVWIFFTGLIRHPNRNRFWKISITSVIMTITRQWNIFHHIGCAECCINRKLKKHTGLRSYFLTESEKDKRFFRLNKAFSKNRQNSIWYSLQAILPTFTNFDKLLQTEEPLIQCLHGETQPFMNKLASKFLKSEIMHKLKDCNLS